MRSIFAILFYLLFLNFISGQNAEFTMEVSNDTVLLGNYFIVKYKITNAEGKFEAPDFSGFDIVGGPMSNSMFSMVNGKTTSESSYTYYLQPKETGRMELPQARLKIGDNTLYTENADIVTKENPENIRIIPKLKDDNNIFFIENDVIDDKRNQDYQKEEKRKKFNIRKL